MKMRKQLVEFTEYMRVEKNYSPKTVDNYYNDIKQYSDLMDVYDVNSMSKQNIRSFLSMIKDNGIAASSGNRKLAAIRSFCRFLCSEGYITTNPAADIQTAKLEKRLPVSMTKEETFDVLSSTSNVRDRTVMEILYATGARVSELTIIKFKDIDFLSCRVKLFGKGGKERIVPMTDSSIASINALIKERGGVDSNDYVFPSPKNSMRPISAKAIYDLVLKHTKFNNLEGITPHKFRHTFATHLYAGDMDIRGIQELLGHADISTTQIYTKVLQENLVRSYHLAHPLG